MSAFERAEAMERLGDKCDALEEANRKLQSLLEEAAHVIIAHQCKDISEEWCALWGAKYEATQNG